VTLLTFPVTGFHFNVTATTGSARTPPRDFNAEAAAANFPPIHSRHGIVSVTGIIELHECKTRRFAGYPNFTDPSIFRKILFQISILDTDANIRTSNIEFRGHFP